MVPLTGFEPVRSCLRGILSPLRLPVSPQRQIPQKFRGAAPKKIRQTKNSALSGFIWSRRRDSNPRPLGPEPSALPNCATPRRNGFHYKTFFLKKQLFFKRLAIFFSRPQKFNFLTDIFHLARQKVFAKQGKTFHSRKAKKATSFY